jgi:hypothetical protein
MRRRRDNRIGPPFASATAAGAEAARTSPARSPAAVTHVSLSRQSGVTYMSHNRQRYITGTFACGGYMCVTQGDGVTYMSRNR